MKISSTTHLSFLWFLAALLLGVLPLRSQTPAVTCTVSGYISDAEADETLISATIIDRLSGQGTVTNSYGFYSLTLPAGAVELTTSYVGYRSVSHSFVLSRDTVINFRLPVLEALEEVTIIGNRLDLGVKGSQMSAVDIPIAQIKAVPAMFGETDVLKALQLLPGVTGGTEGTAGLYVRGGAPDENLLLIDGVPVYNVNHMFGFFSVFNPDAIKNVTLYKGSFPAHYSGRLSSIVDVRMKDGDLYHWHGNASIGFVSSKINVEGPIVKGKTSLNISARRTYSDLFINTAILGAELLDRDLSDYRTRVGYYFYDLNVKLNHKFSDTDRLYVSWYSGDDDVFFRMKEREDDGYKIQERFGWKWGNTVAAVRWNHVVTPRLFMDVSANYTQYRHRLSIGVDERNPAEGASASAEMAMRSGIYDYTGRADFHWSPVAAHDVRFGSNLTRHTYRPDVASVMEDITQKPDPDAPEDPANPNGGNYHFTNKVGGKDIHATEWQSYIEDNMTVADIFKFNAGLSFSLFHVGGHTYSSLEPRFSGRALVTDDLSVKAGYAYMTQYVHLLNNNSLTLPTDLWVPVTENILPEHSHQVATGVFYTLEDLCDLSVEGYYKTCNNLLEYRDGVSYMTGSTDWQDKVAMGRGWSYGVEFMAQRSVGKLNGWVSYTWSRTRRQFDRPGMELNFGRPFDAKYDRRHEFDITGSYTFNDRIDVGATWIYATGNCGSLYTQYALTPVDTPYGYVYYDQVGWLSERNNFRMAPYHRLDLSVNFHKQLRKGLKRTWNISVYNVYNHKNPFLVYLDEDYEYDMKLHTEVCRTHLMQASLFPIIPTFSYSLAF